MVKKRISALFLTLALLLTLCPLSAFAAENDLDEDIIWVECEGIGGVDDTLPLSSALGTTSGLSYTTSYYEQLDENSKTVYNAIYAEASPLKAGPAKYDSNDKNTFVSFNIPCTSEEDASLIIGSALAALIYDHPELSWLVNTRWSYGYQSNSSNMTAITRFQMSDIGYKQATTDPKNVGIPDSSNDIYDYADTKDRAAINAAITNAKNEIGDLSGRSDYEKVKTLYDWVCNNMEYAHYKTSDPNYNADEAAKYENGWRGYQTAYSALVEEVTVCAGYAKSFKLLCDEYGIPCAIIRGTSHGENHAWNYVQVGEGANKGWYAIDCTWADQSTYISYDYLLKGSTSFTDHNATTLSAYAEFVYPHLSEGDYTDPSAPDSIELTYDASNEQTSQSDKKYFKVPTVTALGIPATTEISFAAKPMKSGVELSNQKVQWVLSAGTDGVTLRTNDDDTATLVISNSANADYDPAPNYIGGYTVTVTAMCGTTSAKQQILIWGEHKTASFVQISEGDKTLSSNDTATYSAKVYDQYGIEISADRQVTDGTRDSNNKLVYKNMTVPEITWTSSDTNVATVSGGTVTAVAAGSTTITASVGTDANAPSASVTVTVMATTPTVTTLTNENTTITLANETGLTYTGAEIKPTVTVTDGSKTLIEGTDYTVAYSNNTNAKEATATDAPTVTITGAGNYAGAVTKNFAIKKADTTVTATANLASIAVDGTTAVNATVKRGNTTITPASGQVTYTSDHLNIATVDENGSVTGAAAGTATITVTYAGDDNHNGSNATVLITVNTKGAHNLTVPEVQTLTYGEEKTATATSSTGGSITYTSSDSSVVTVDGNGKLTAKKVGNASITVTAAASGAYTEATGTFGVTVNAKTISVTAEAKVKTYGAVDPTLTYVSEPALLPGDNFTGALSRDSGEDVGTYAITQGTLSAGDNYAITFQSANLTINKATPTVTAPTAKTLTYNGSAQELVNAGNTTGGTLQYRLGDTGTYSTTIPTATNAGMYTVYYKVDGGTNYSDVNEASVEVTIAQAALTIKAKDQAIAYGGSIVTGTNQVEATGLVFSDNLDSITLTANGTAITPSAAMVKKDGTDVTANYSITYQNGTLTVNAKSISDATIEAIADQTYTGSAITPTITVKDGSTALTKDTDYTVMYSNNTNAGTATVTITGRGNYSGTVTTTFTIIAKALPDNSITVTGTYTYTGSTITPTVTVKDGSTALTKDTDYTVVYSNNINAGTATVTVTGKGNYSGTQAVSFTIGKANQAPLTIGDNTTNVVYGDTVSLTASGGTGDGAVTWSVTGPATVNDGAVTITGTGSITVKAVKAGGNNYEDAEATVTFTAKAKTLTVIGASVTNRKYDGTTAVAITAVALDGVINSDDVSATATGTIGGSNAGTYTSVTLSNLELTGAKAANYVLANPSGVTVSNVSVVISKADALTPIEGDLPVVNGLAHTYTYTYGLGSLRPAAPAGQSYGADVVTYILGTISLGDYYTEGASVSGTELTLPIQAVEGGAPADIGTITVTISSQNFADMTATIKVRSVNKKMPTGEPTLSASSITYGQPLSTITLSGNMKATGDDGNEIEVPGAFAWGSPNIRPTAQDSYSAAWQFTPTDNSTYAIVTGTATIKVNKADQAALTISGNTANVVYGDAFALTASGGNGDGAVTWSVTKGNTIATVASDTGRVTIIGVGSVEITVTKAGNTNYNKATATVTFTVSKATPEVTAPSGLEITSGATLSTVALPSGWTWDNPSTTVSETGTFPATYTPTDTVNYNTVNQRLTVTVKAAVTGHTHSGDGKWRSDTTNHWHECTAADCPLTDVQKKYDTAAHTPGDWITDRAATSTTAGSRHKECTVCGYTTVTESIPATGGSSSGGSTGGSTGGSSTPSTPPVTTDKTTDNGKPATETTAKPTATTKGGTATTTVSSTVGSEIVKQAEQNKSGNVVIVPEIKGDVTKAEVSIPASTVGQIGSKTEASLTVSTPVANVTIPNEALSGLSETGGSVKVTTERTGNTVELSVKAGSKTVDSIPGGMKVTVPVEKPTPGTVAVLVREDGTRQVIRKSTVGEDGVTIPLDGSAKIEIVDNSKQFNDVPETSWAFDATAFASSHELFNGTAPGQFSPDVPMSRGMLAVVLHNLESNPEQALTGAFSDVDSGKWYAEGVSWAAEKGIVTGYSSGQFGPEDDITREQLAVMLWRYAGSPSAADGSLNFTDAGKTSSWAKEAMLWATEKGIINGKGNGILDPTGKATRAQTAQMLKNFMDM